MRFDCASSPEAAIFSNDLERIGHGHTFRACHQHAMERLEHAGVERIGAVDLARLAHLLLEADGVAGMQDLAALRPASTSARAIRQMPHASCARRASLAMARLIVSSVLSNGLTSWALKPGVLALATFSAMVDWRTVSQ